MSEKNTDNAEVFAWVDLETPDVKASKSFYSEILNWNYSEMKSPTGDSYFVIENQGRGIGGITTGKTPRWMGYVFVDDVDAYTKKAKQLGATVIDEPFDVGDMGRKSTLKDPTGAQFCLWKNKVSSAGKDVGMNNEPGNFCWPELATRDPKTAQKFYTELFGWTVGGAPIPNYTIFHKGEGMVGSMLPITNEMKIEPQWFIYFSVDDCDQRVEQAKKMKATIGVPPTDIPSTGRLSVLKDPQGAHVSFIKLIPMNRDSADENSEK